MSYVLQIDFKFKGPFGEAMSMEFEKLAESINLEKGFIKKVWTESEARTEAGGHYHFETEEDAENYLKMHLERLRGFGIEESNVKIFKVNEKLSLINKGWS
ncbi:MULTISPECIES: monooxygenase [Paenibacillus]|uniref:Putative monooxygenase ydhR n=1 Tax=Paenibacillus pabuli TaxID=1472 RepID=A0A855Y1L5_9BACL|nr:MULTISPECIES: monooxygenase [Paenibacillus]PWW35022.1 putative monooxygenase ydhR [Paenibacillus pabuli]PXW01780.1 putative monooxygenase ydhR [Paenibacillus taichungensis]